VRDRPLRAREPGLRVGAALFAEAFLGALAQLFEIHGSLLPDAPEVRKHRAGGVFGDRGLATGSDDSP